MTQSHQTTNGHSTAGYGPAPGNGRGQIAQFPKSGNAIGLRRHTLKTRGSGAFWCGAGALFDVFGAWSPKKHNLEQRTAAFFNEPSALRLASDWDRVGQYLSNALAHDLVRHRKQIHASKVTETNDITGQLFLFQLGEYELKVKGRLDAE